MVILLGGVLERVPEVLVLVAAAFHPEQRVVGPGRIIRVNEPAGTYDRVVGGVLVPRVESGQCVVEELGAGGFLVAVGAGDVAVPLGDVDG